MNSEPTVGVVHADEMLLHCSPSDSNPERPERLSVAIETLEQCGLLAQCRRLPSRSATDAELLRVHAAEHVARVGAAAAAVKAEPTDAKRTMPHGDGGIYYHEHTDVSARVAAGCVLQATDAVVDGEVGGSFAVVRPPGHHAEVNEARGFCFYNNVAVAAQHALARGVPRVAIVDWDVHHGNGTQHIFESEPRVLFISLHRFGRGFFPGSGAAHEMGEGAGRGTTVNVPWQQARRRPGWPAHRSRQSRPCPPRAGGARRSGLRGRVRGARAAHPARVRRAADLRLGGLRRGRGRHAGAHARDAGGLRAHGARAARAAEPAGAGGLPAGSWRTGFRS